MSFLIVAEFIRETDDLYKKLDMIIQNSEITKIQVVDNKFKVVPSISESKKMDSKEVLEYSENPIYLEFMPDYDNMDSKISALEFMGVDFLEMISKEYPEPVCMDCGKKSKTYEEVDVGMGEYELWVFCRECDLETFHELPEKYKRR